METEKHTAEVTIPATRFSPGDIILFRGFRLRITRVHRPRCGRFVVMDGQLVVDLDSSWYSLDDPADIRDFEAGFGSPLPTCNVEPIDREAKLVGVEQPAALPTAID